jgi:hypothetical protein
VDLTGIDFVADILGNFSGLTSSSSVENKPVDGFRRLPITAEATGAKEAEQGVPRR